MKINKLLASLGLSVVCFTAASPAHAAVAGHVQFVDGNVQITNPAGQTRLAQKGDAINEGDTLTSAQKASAQIKMQDGGFVAVRAETKLKFDEFVFAGKEDGSEKSFFSLFKGGFRAVTGLIGRINKQNYRITTPAATIGIRGTDHETFLIVPGSPLAQVAPTGAYNKVNVGETFMATEKGTIFIQPNQMGFAGGMNQVPQVQPINTKIFTVAEAPAPEAKAEKKEKKEEKAEAKQEEKTAKNDKEEKKEDKKEDQKEGKEQKTAKSDEGTTKGEAKTESAAEAGGTGQTTETAATEPAPIRETAVVDAAPPATSGAPAPSTSTIASTTTVTKIIAPPPTTTTNTILTTATTAGGTTANLTTGTVTAAGGQTIVVAQIINPPAGNWSAWSQPTVGAAGAYQRGVLGTAIPLANINFLLDAGGNLITALHAGYREQATWSTAPATSVYTDATITFSGGTANDYYMLPDGSRAIGRWTGGTMTITDNLGALPTIVKNLGVSSAPWTMGQTTPDLYIQTLTGTTTYTKQGATLPTDSFGNVGTAPTATLVANFTNMTVDASVAFTIANQALSVTATAMPIGLNVVNQSNSTGFYARSENGNAPTITCTGAGCSAGGYLGRLIGGFDGAAAASVDFDYTIWPTAAANSLVSDIIQGIVVFATATAPSVATNPPAPPAGNWTAYGVYNVEVSAGQWLRARFSDNGLPATSFVLDGSGNLVKSLHANYREQPIWRVAAVPQASYNDATITYSGGVASDYFTDGNVAIGRWTGGTMTIVDNLAVQSSLVKNLGVTSSAWSLVSPTPAAYVSSLGGIVTYTLAGATLPTNSAGAVGTLTSASVTANFTNQTVDAAIALSIASQNLALSATAVPMVAGFSDAMPELGNAPTVSCTGAGCSGGGYLGRLGVQLAGATAASAEMGYMVWPTAPVDSTVSDMIRGEIALSASTPPVVVAPAGTVAPYVQTDVAAAFVTTSADYLQPYTSLNSGIMPPADINNNLPNPSFTERYAGKDPNSYIVNTLSGTTTIGAATTALANGIQFGRYNSTQSTKLVVGNTYYGAAGTYTSPAAVFLHWITGPAVDPVYLPEILLTPNPAAPAVYTLAGSTVPTDPFGGAPTLNSASLTVDFTKQLVAFSLGLTVAGGSWTATATGTPLEFTRWNNAKTGFKATSVARPGWGSLTVTGATSGDVMGQLTGPGLNGALLSYALTNGSNQVSGVAAFNGAVQAAPSYRLAGLSAADPNPPASAFPNGVYPAGGVVPTPVMLGGYNNSASVTMDGTGNLTGFRSDGGYSSGAYTVSKGAATATGPGTDPVSGISWGRWDNASFTHTNVVTAAAGIVNTGSAHWIASPTFTGPVTLPVTGTFNYVLAGGTAPTDSLGGVGTLNSATLSANFAAQTVTVGLNVTTPNAGNLIASAANLPIQQKSFFEAATANAIQGGGAPGSLTVTCGAGCTGTPQGHLAGAFAGAGGLGAALLYGFAAGANNTTIVNGVAAFHR